MKGLLKKVRLLAVLIIVCFMSTSVIIAAENDAEALFEKRCSMCHLTSRPLNQTKSHEEWRQTVTRMKNYADGRISAEEAEMIINYLTEIRGK